jgi:putative ABC transport system permease protein
MKPFKLYFRNMLKNKVFSTITIGSFAVSIAVIIVLASFLVSEFSYDSHIKNIDRIYRIKASENKAFVPEKSRDLLLSQIPGIEAASNYIIGQEPVVYNGNNFDVKIINSDEGLFSVLSIEFIIGRPDGIFGDKNNVVITNSLSKKIFGNENPIGKILKVSHREDVRVAAVINDFPEKSSLSGDLICSADLRIRYSQNCYENCSYLYSTLILLKPGISDNEVSKKLTAIIPKIHKKDNNQYSLLPYKNAYFDTSLDNDTLSHANVKLLQLLAWLTVVLLFLAVFNYINLSVAQSTNRFKEFGIKHTLGASRAKVFAQFIREAFLTTLAATFFAIIIAGLIHPLFVTIFGKAFSIYSILASPWSILTSISTLVGIATVSSVYPAYMATKVQAKDLLQRRLNAKTRGFDLRKSLIITQFAATIAIMVSLIVITKQIDYAKTMDLGFKTEQLVRIPIHWQAANKADVLKNTLNSIPGVKNSCYSHGTPGSIYMHSWNDIFENVSIITSDYSFAETLGITIIEGRNFSEGEKTNVCLINKSAMKQAGWDSFEGKEIFGRKVVGVIDDFHYENLYNKIGVLMIENGKSISHFTVRILPGNTAKTLAAIEKGFKKILPEYGFSFQFYDEYFDSMYKQDEKRADSIRIISIIAILISCIGLIGLVEFSTKSRTKEIGIRKVNGAKISELMAMLNTDFVTWVAIAFIIACPIAWYAMNKWLESFAYKTELSWWIFALAGAMALGIALLTVSWQSWRAATRNPVEALRYE